MKKKVLLILLLGGFGCYSQDIERINILENEKKNILEKII
jgi:hypothetical protein